MCLVSTICAYYVFTDKQWHPACFLQNKMFLSFLEIQVKVLSHFYIENRNGSEKGKQIEVQRKEHQSRGQTAAIKLAAAYAPVLFHQPSYASAVNNSHGKRSVITPSHRYQKSVNGIIRKLC